MQLAKVEIVNIRLIEHLVFKTGALTVIRGKNGLGKTTVLDAIKAAFEGGHDPTLLRQGTQKGWCILTLDDGTTISTVAKPNKTDRSVVVPGSDKPVEGPAAYIAALSKGFAFDPLAFIDAPSSARAKYLADQMPITITNKQIAARVELAPLRPKVESLITGREYDVAALRALRDKLYADRTTANKQLKTQEGGIDALRRTLPDNWKPEGDPHEVVNAARIQVRDSKKALDAIYKRRDDAVSDWDKTLAADIAQVDRWEAAEIDKIRVEAAGVRKAKEVEGKQTRNTLSHSLDSEIESAQVILNEANGAESVAHEQAKHFATQQQSAATIEQYSKDRRETQAEVDVLTAAIDAIDAAKDRAMRESPVPGVTWEGGEVYYQPGDLESPIPFDVVNTQKKYMLALRIASLGAGALGLMCIDGAESIVGEDWTAFEKACLESGFQVIATRADAAYKTIDVEYIDVTEPATT